jgi:hypothetical protein
MPLAAQAQSPTLDQAHRAPSGDAGHEIDGRGLDGLAAFTAQAAKKIFEGHIASALHQQPHGVADRTTSAVLAVQLDHALRPVR